MMENPKHYAKAFYDFPLGTLDRRGAASAIHCAFGGNRGNRVGRAGQAFFQGFAGLCLSRQPVPTVPTEKPPFPPRHLADLPGVVSWTGPGRRSTPSGNWEPGPKFDSNPCPARDLLGSRAVGTGGNPGAKSTGTAWPAAPAAGGTPPARVASPWRAKRPDRPTVAVDERAGRAMRIEFREIAEGTGTPARGFLPLRRWGQTGPGRGRAVTPDAPRRRVHGEAVEREGDRSRAEGGKGVATASLSLRLAFATELLDGDADHSSGGEVIREEAASSAAQSVPADAAVDVAGADWRKCGSCGGGADRSRLDSASRTGGWWTAGSSCENVGRNRRAAVAPYSGVR
jgi:hypothetical protein